MRTALSPWLLVALSGCSVRYLPAPAAPPRQGQALAPPSAPAENEGTLTLEADRAARVEVVTGRQQADPQSNPWGMTPNGYANGPLLQNLSLRPLCRTPCAVNLPRGDHELLFSDLDPSTRRVSLAIVRVGDRPSIARHALGRQTTSLGNVVGALLLGGFGLMGLATGGMLLGFGTTEAGTDLRPAGYITLGIGAALGVGSWLLADAARPTQQPGATTQWTP